MRIALLDTYYPRFLASHYSARAELANKTYVEQRQELFDRLFGTADFYSRHLRALGHEAHDLIVNCVPLQEAWAQANGVKYSGLAVKVPQRLLRLPGVGLWMSLLPGLVDIAVKQIQMLRPDVLYCQDLWFLPPRKMADLRRYVKLVVGQIASPMPPAEYLSGYDLILTSFPHFVPRLRAAGVASEYLRIAFDTRVLELIGKVEPDVDASFVGGISRHHGRALPMLEYLARNTPIEFYGYGAGGLSRRSPILPRHRGEVWGLEMYRTLARSRLTLNRHIDVSENFANNMRLYEATGVGALLITDRKDNLNELFEIGKEVVAYSSAEEAAELIRYYVAHPAEASAIARAGQARTLREHTYRHRMEELVPILDTALRKKLARVA